MNLAYEAATADLSDVNMIDPYHMEAYGRMAVNYNRDIEVFPVLDAIFTKFQGHLRTVLRQIWVLTWRETVYVMMRLCAKHQKMKL